MSQANKSSLNDILYFQPNEISFWRWADAMDVVEGISGYTICYRRDMAEIIREISVNGLPGLGNILLCISACGARADNCEESLHIMFQAVTSRNDVRTQALAARYTNRAKRLLNLIQGLPVELRSGTRRIHLMNELFSVTQDKVNSATAQSMLDDFSSGRWDYSVLKPAAQTNLASVAKESEELGRIISAYPDSGKLEIKLRTGLQQLPEVIEIEILEKSKQDKSLLEELAEDDETAGIAQLTQRLIAALNIPMHAANASDHSYGGISDISNRGNFDKLLLSELANDDLALMARLVNNEALYLRREAPPVNFDQERNILVDTTIKMWGLPRAFGVATALAFSQNQHHVSAVSAYALGEEEFTAIDLASKTGVLNALQKLDAGMHGCQALLAFLEQQECKTNTENIFITSDDTLTHPEFYRHHDEIQQGLKFLVTVNRHGDLQFYEFINGHRKPLSSGKFDLNEALSKRAAISVLNAKSDELPAFYKNYGCPLYFPTLNVNISPKNLFKDPDGGLIGVNTQGRLLYWPTAKEGARQLLADIEGAKYGKFCYGTRGKGTGYLLVYNTYPGTVKIYLFSLSNDNHLREPLAVHNLSKIYNDISQEIYEAFYHAGTFYIRCGRDSIVCADAESGIISNMVISKDVFLEKLKTYKSAVYPPENVRKFINNGYSVFLSETKGEISDTGSLVICRRNLELKPKQRGVVKNFYLTSASKLHDRRTSPIKSATPLFGIHFTREAWPDGSIITQDTNGIIHLRSSNLAIPEISIVSILDKPTACWSSDKNFSGSEYFYKVSQNQAPMPVQTFYDIYIQRFIDNIIAKCS